MKRILILKFTFILASQTSGQQGEWTWMHGNNIPNQPAQYGIKGVPDTGNTPGAVYEPIEWIDNVGNLWLFGGVDNSNLEYNALWRYYILTNEWTWMHGDNTAEQSGVYGTVGVSSPSNKPGARAWGAQPGLIIVVIYGYMVDLGVML